MLFNVPGARSSPLWPAIVTLLDLVGCLYCRCLPFVATKYQPSTSRSFTTSCTFILICLQRYLRIIRTLMYLVLCCLDHIYSVDRVIKVFGIPAVDWWLKVKAIDDYWKKSPNEDLSIKQNWSVLQSASSKSAKNRGFLISLWFYKRFRGRFKQTDCRKNILK